MGMLFISVDDETQVVRGGEEVAAQVEKIVEGSMFNTGLSSCKEAA